MTAKRKARAVSVDVVHLLTAFCVCVTTAIGFAHFWLARHHSTRATTATTPVLSGDVVNGKLCQDERRHSPTGGRWLCVGTQPIPAGSRVRTPLGESTNCSHRELEEDTWHCLTRVPVPALFLRYPLGGPAVYVGDRGSAVVGRRPTKSSICTTEVRDHRTWGVWTCAAWKDVPPDQVFFQAIDPGGPCLARDADSETGIWTCTTSDIPKSATGGQCWVYTNPSQEVCLTGDGRQATLTVKRGG